MKSLTVIYFLIIGVIITLAQDLEDCDARGNCKVIRIQRVSDAISRSRGYSQMVVIDYLETGVREIVLAGQTFVADGTLEGQIRAIWEAIAILLDVAGADLQKIVSMISSIADITDEKIDLFTRIRRGVLSDGNDPDTFVYPETSMTLGADLARTFLLVEIKVEKAILKTPRDWRLKPFPEDIRLGDLVYKRLNITPIDM